MIFFANIFWRKQNYWITCGLCNFLTLVNTYISVPHSIIYLVLLNFFNSLCFFISLCVLYMYVPICVGTLIYVCTHKSQRSTLRIFLYCWDPTAA